MKKSIIICIVLIVITVILILCKMFVINDQNITNIKSYNHIKKAQKHLNKYNYYPQKDAINIVAITDANFITPLNVAIYSAIKNKHKNSKYNFYIIGIDLNSDHIRELTKQSTEETPIIVIQNKNIYDFDPFKHPSHVPISDCFKFNIPDLFPHFDKMLYLDGDIIVQNDLSNLYTIDIKDYYLAAHLYSYDKHGYDKALNFRVGFNNGVMLLNLKKMRKSRIPEKLLICKIFIAPRYMITQDAFNIVLKSKVLGFDKTYNICTEFMGIDTKKHKDETVKNGVIIHYANINKPWKNPNAPYGEIWHKYHQEFIQKYK